MSSTAVQLRHAAPTTRPSRRTARSTQRRGPQAHPQRLATPGRMELASTGSAGMHACAVVPMPVSTGWKLTERGYAVLVGSFAVAALFLVTMLVTTFVGISNAPLG